MNDLQELLGEQRLEVPQPRLGQRKVAAEPSAQPQQELPVELAPLLPPPQRQLALLPRQLLERPALEEDQPLVDGEEQRVDTLDQHLARPALQVGTELGPQVERHQLAQVAELHDPAPLLVEQCVETDRLDEQQPP
ncbi:hypothetical protein [Mumia zhuanghuii]|uniref:Uncharacterized protein n=1 Tax=Mumia zhuanghuii TaxID=2585211 RepID=A0A5C4MCA4_9ACTN|nr:hypothetical protein [Mumia zhuanghuii]TNC35582.1 hypothetical protein FHE65_26915 [Mumia zhuanghuii]